MKIDEPVKVKKTCHCLQSENAILS